MDAHKFKGQVRLLYDMLGAEEELSQDRLRRLNRATQVIRYILNARMEYTKALDEAEKFLDDEEKELPF